MFRYTVILLCLLCCSCVQEEVVIKINLDDKIKKAEASFDYAERTILRDDVPNNPDDEIIRPDPDPDKCPCKGTGEIKHGDGHTTECPFHSINLMFKSYEGE